MKVLVTGANGFLGAWLTRSLVDQGHEVYALVRKNSDLSELNGVSCKYLYGDVTDLSSLQAAFQGIDTVFHLAGVIAYKKSERPLMDKVNVNGTKNVITAVQSCSVRKLVYLSSVVAIGSSFTPIPLNEKSPYNIHHLNLGYFETKHLAEKLVIEACQNKFIDAVMVNPSTIYGAGDAKKGSRKAQLSVARGKMRFYTSGGVNVVAIEDVIDGIMNVWKMGKTGERYILAGENITIKDLFTMIAKEAGQKPPRWKIPNFVLHLLGALSDFLLIFDIKLGFSRENAYTATMFHWFDSSKARQELQFHPRPAAEAIRNSVDWIKKNGLLK